MINETGEKLREKLGLSPDDKRCTYVLAEGAVTHYKTRPKVTEDVDRELAFKNLQLKVWQLTAIVDLLIDRIQPECLHAFDPED